MKPFYIKKATIIFIFCLFQFSLSQTKIVITDPYSKEDVTYAQVINWKDNSPMNDSKTDGTIYLKKANLFYKRVYNGKINVKWFGAKGDGLQDDTKSIQNALNYGESLYFPAGKYKINCLVPKHMEIEGDSGNTFLQPYDLQKPVLIYKAKDPYWTYASIISSITFLSSNMQGIGVSFGEGKMQDKQQSDQYSGNVVFRNVLFKGFYQGIFFPFGNIGCNFYSCSFQQNYYGAYNLDNKMGGDPMHAGNKYFYACEFDSNKVGFYFNNFTDGFGGVSFTDVVFQSNMVNGYFYSNTTYFPVSFMNCWDEKGMNMDPKILIDQYNGTKLSKKEYKSASFIMEGSNSTYNFIGGRLMNLNIFGDQIVVNSYSSKFEFLKGAGSDQFSISEKSYLKLYYPSTDNGIQSSPQIEVIGFPQLSKNALTGSYANPDARFFPLDNKKISPTVPEYFSTNFNKEIALNGSFVAQKPKLEKSSSSQTFSNKVTLDFNQKNQFISVENTKKTLTKGYYFISMEVKINKGNPTIFVWDRNVNQMVRFVPTADNKFHKYGAFGYLSNSADIFLDFTSNDAKIVDFNISSYKIYQFDTLENLRKFLDSKIIED